MTSAAPFDPYAALGVARDASAAQIRAAYLDLASRYHPDRHQGNPLEDLASAKLIEVNRAYEILSDPGRRSAYDRGAGDASAASGASAAPARGGDPMSPAARRLMKFLPWLVALPLLFRFGGLLVRGLVSLAEAALEASIAIRGTPVAAALALLAVVGLAVALVRHLYRGRKRR
jgi:curved DNA-binding protein CbpA